MVSAAFQKKAISAALLSIELQTGDKALRLAMFMPWVTESTVDSKSSDSPTSDQSVLV